MPRAPHKFGPAARRRFLEHLKETGHLGQSAAAAGVHYTTTRRRLVPGHRLYDPTLVDDVEEARLAYAEKLLGEAYRRGVEGWIERGLYVNGRHVGDVRKYSDKLLMHLLRRYDPEYREDVRVIVQERVVQVDAQEITEAVVRRLSAPERLQLHEALAQQAALAELAAGRASTDAPAPAEELTPDEQERRTALVVPANRAALRDRLQAEGRRVPAWMAR